LYEIFFRTYTEKVWGMSCKEIRSDWAAQRIKGLDFVQVLKSALLPNGKPRSGEAVIKTLIDSFRYPRLGPGQMWERVRDLLLRGGRPVLMGREVESVWHSGGRVRHVTVRTADGRRERFVGDHFISSLPIRTLIAQLDPPPPRPVLQAAASLRYRDFLTVALMLPRPEVFPDNWIYVHDPGVKVGRIQNFKNWSEAMVPDPRLTCLGLEYFCFEGDDLWSSSEQDLVDRGRRELERIGICRSDEVFDGVVVRQPKAYPVYHHVYQEHLAVIREYLRQLPNLHLAGRNGMHKYNNQDHSMLTALLVARNIAGESQLDPWKVNADAEYHEEARVEDSSGRLMPSRIGGEG
jgi:protoporphyrinogen oxidase